MIINYLDQTSKAVQINVHGHHAFVELIPHMFMVAVLGIDPENALSLPYPFNNLVFAQKHLLVYGCSQAVILQAFKNKYGESPWYLNVLKKAFVMMMKGLITKGKFHVAQKHLLVNACMILSPSLHAQ